MSRRAQTLRLRPQFGWKARPARRPPTTRRRGSHGRDGPARRVARRWREPRGSRPNHPPRQPAERGCDAPPPSRIAGALLEEGARSASHLREQRLHVADEPRAPRGEVGRTGPTALAAEAPPASSPPLPRCLNSRDEPPGSGAWEPLRKPMRSSSLQAKGTGRQRSNGGRQSKQSHQRDRNRGAGSAGPGYRPPRRPEGAGSGRPPAPKERSPGRRNRRARGASKRLSRLLRSKGRQHDPFPKRTPAPRPKSGCPVGERRVPAAARTGRTLRRGLPPDGPDLRGRRKQATRRERRRPSVSQGKRPGKPPTHPEGHRHR